MKTGVINKLMTHVVRMQEPVSLFLPDGTLRTLKWVPVYAEPQIFYPAMDENTPVEAGIVGCISFLRSLPDETEYKVELQASASFGWCAACTNPLVHEDDTFCPKCEAEAARNR